MVYVERQLSYYDATDGRRITVPQARLIAWTTPVIILGEPGMGKSGLLKALAFRDPKFELVSATALKRRRVPVAPGKVLLIDGLDELPGAQEQDPVQDVLEKLADLGGPPFFLSCRANDWRDVAKQSIREDYGREPFEFRLSAFGEEEAVDFLKARHGETVARDLIKRMDDQGIGEFYGNPLTLQLIDRLATSHKGLPLDRAELFLRASDDLRQEQNPERPRSLLASLSKDQALDAAGAACAALILTGSEAINLGAQGATLDGDLALSDVTALPVAGALGVVVSSMLFERRDGGDRVAPFHRAMAEFLAARWLSSRVDNASARRLLALMSHQGGIPASVRGVHAWLAYFSPEMRSAVILADPFGVLRYGDATYLTPSEASHLLRALEDLSEADPYFASDDGRRHRAPALTQLGMADELRRVLMAPQSAFQLKSILLLALPRTEAAPLLAADLETILMTAEPDRGSFGGHPNFTFHERRAAFDVLLELWPRDSWSERLEILFRRRSEDDRRLAVEAIPAIGTEHFEPMMIARAALAHTGLLPGADGPRSVVESYGDLHILSRAIEDDQVPRVLDGLVVLSPATKGIDWRAAYEFSGFVDQLTMRALKLDLVRAEQLLGWCRLIKDRNGGEKEARDFINIFLRNTASVRRAIQRHIVLVEAPIRQTIDWVWRLHEIHPALSFTEEDVLDLLAAADFPDLIDEHARETWRRLVAQAGTTLGLPHDVRVLARAMAAGDTELETFLAEIDRKRIPDWQRKEKIRQWRKQSRDRRYYERRRHSFQALELKIAEGSWMGLANPADVYLNRYADLLHDASPRERLIAWIGEDLAELMLAGFEASLHRADHPSPREIGESYANGKRFRSTSLLLAGVGERALAGRDLEDLSEDVVVSVAMGQILESVPEKVGTALKDALDRWFKTRPAARERTWRLALEPQFQARRDNVLGLYPLVRAPHGDLLATKLAVDWLERYPELSAFVEAELLDHLSRRGEWTTLKALLKAREILGYRDDDHRLLWSAIAFFVDFEARRAALETLATEQPNLFWTIRRRGWPTDEQGRGRVLGLDQLAWLVLTFREAFPATERPSGSSSGDTNPWDASDFLRGLVRRIAGDTSDPAVSILAALRDEVADDYRPFLKNACAQQLKARREAGFKPSNLDALSFVLRNQSPTSVADLQALAIDTLALVQSRMNRDAVDQVSMFYDGAVPKSEEDCSKSVVILLRDLIGHGIDTTPEYPMPGDNRADIVLALNDFRLPIEAKGQWHKKLWVAASEQLDAFYAIEWRARGYGIYLVFWFGSEVPDQKKLRSPGRGVRRPDTPEALKAALTARIPEHRRGQITIVVLDVSRKLGSSLVPAP
jgi:hypothetical protein